VKALPRQYYEDTESGFKPDMYRDLSGGISVDPDFIKELNRIDPRLVLRWDPFDPCWKVWIRMSDGRLWCRPTWECRHPETGRPWKPQGYDIRQIQITKWRAEQDWRKRDEAQRAKEIALDYEAARAKEAYTAKRSANWAKKNDLTWLKAGFARGTAGGDPVRRKKK
jgi:hypothetical protein